MQARLGPTTDEGLRASLPRPVADLLIVELDDARATGLGLRQGGFQLVDASEEMAVVGGGRGGRDGRRRGPGYVYVISNVGAFGPNVVKIGMTRRLEPLDRVHELGDASVPFRYDVHVLHFSDDAITLENELHKAFADRRVNFVNERREFFFATPAEVREILMQKAGGILEFNQNPAAEEYFQSRSRWPEALR